MIDMRDLHKAFGAVKAVDGVSLTAADGGVTGLLGPNGAGKTTILRMVCGLVRPTRGVVRVDGLRVLDQPLAVRRRIGVLSDARGLYPRLTARENIGYFAALHGLSGRALGQRVEQLLALLEMADIADRRVLGFSQGERMKTAIARALVHDPQNVLLDEPTNGLDVMTVRSLRRAIRGLAAAGKCVVLSTHIMQEVAALCERVVVIADGRIRVDGAPDALVAQSGQRTLEDAVIKAIGSERGLAA
jgi:sodium transport system ATP-binding protein